MVHLSNALTWSSSQDKGLDHTGHMTGQVTVGVSHDIAGDAQCVT